MAGRFCIKDGYVENPRPVYFVDNPTAERGIVFQPDVYTFAEMMAEASGVTTIVDIGCGWGDKLASMHDRHPDWRIIGVDYGENIERCRREWPWGEWHACDLEHDPPPDSASSAVVICSDVIEHLVDPTTVMEVLTHSPGHIVVISTPERDVQYGADHNGPPPNLCHVREWNAAELNEWMSSFGATILHHGLTRGSDQGWAMATQLVVVG